MTILPSRLLKSATAIYLLQISRLSCDIHLRSALSLGLFSFGKDDHISKMAVWPDIDRRRTPISLCLVDPNLIHFFVGDYVLKICKNDGRRYGKRPCTCEIPRVTPYIPNLEFRFFRSTNDRSCGFEDSHTL